MAEHLVIGLISILTIGMLAQWISWRFGLPSILLLLLFGFILGPVTHLVEPDEILGEILFPFVSLSVAIILFEGGLTLKFKELKSVGMVVLRLLLVAIPITLILASLFAYFVIGLSISLSILFGSILVVTGPTVILPLLRQIKPNSKINSILKWEGIVNDPIGALIAILVFEAILATGLREVTTIALIGVLKTVFLSSLLGAVGALVIVFFIKKDLIPEYLQNGIALAFALLVFVVSNIFQKESGLFAVTIMGIVIANQKKIVISHIVEFKENLRLILISVLFIILAARLSLETLEDLGWSSLAFAALLIVIVRPVAVFASTIGTNLSVKEKIFISSMAPRGIVAAAVSAIFALELQNAGVEGASVLVPLTFMVIISTITVYGLSAAPLARKLKLALPNAQGCLIVGASPFSRKLGKVLQENNFKVVLVDTNWRNVSLARMDGFKTYHGSVTSDYILDEIDYFGLGKMLSMTPNDEVNSLATLNYSKVFGGGQIYQLASTSKSKEDREDVARELKGKVLFGRDYNLNKANELLQNGYVIKTSKITEQYGLEQLREKYGQSEVVPLFIINDNKLSPVLADEKIKLETGNVLISLLREED